MLPRPYATGDEFVMADPLPYHHVDFRIEHVGYLPIEIKFELQDEEITKLIMGERLYGDETACIRELLQNAVDTCREAGEQRPAKWEAKITLAEEEEEEGKVLSVTDNGMGMDEYIVRQYFAKVGMSYYTSEDFKGGFRPISEFGIGILSCFMLADRIEVESKRQGSDPIQLELRSLTQPFVPRPGSRTEPGTTVRLHLKPEKVASLDVLDRVRHFARHVEFPIAVVSRDGSTSVVSDAGFAPSAADLAHLVMPAKEREEYSRFWTPERIAQAHKTIEVGGTRLGVTLLEGLAPIWTMGGRLSQHGFLVGLPEPLARVMIGTWVDVDVGGQNRLALTADRTRTWQQSEETWRELADFYSQAVEALYDRTPEEQSPSEWWRFHASYYYRALWPLPQALRESAPRNAWYCTLTGDGFRARLPAEVAAWKGDLYWVSETHHKELERVRGLMRADMCVVIIPRSGDEEDWCRRLLAGGGVKGAAELLSDLGITRHVAKIAGLQARLVDAGVSLGTWRAGWRWLTTNWGGGAPVFDGRDPFSQILLERCAGPLPQGSRDLVAELLRLAPSYNARELQRHQRHALEVLREDGVIP